MFRISSFFPAAFSLTSPYFLKVGILYIFSHFEWIYFFQIMFLLGRPFCIFMRQQKCKANIKQDGWSKPRPSAEQCQEGTALLTWDLMWKRAVCSHGNHIAHETKIHRPTFVISYSAYKINNDLGMWHFYGINNKLEVTACGIAVGYQLLMDGC